VRCTNIILGRNYSKVNRNEFLFAFFYDSYIVMKKAKPNLITRVRNQRAQLKVANAKIMELNDAIMLLEQNKIEKIESLRKDLHNYMIKCRDQQLKIFSLNETIQLMINSLRNPRQ
jgi:hypothetical protein